MRCCGFHDHLLHERCPPGTARRGRAGLSMIDVVVTTLMMALIAGVAMPRIGNMLAVYRVRAATDRIAADLKLAQHHARTTGSSETVSFDLTNSRYTFSSVTNGDAQGVPYSVDIAAYPFDAVIEAVTFEGATMVTFDGYGYPTSGGKIAVRAGSATRVMALNAATGTVAVGRNLPDAVN